nr:hypothetical protein [Tanacetum cinerariifolium]
MSRYNPSKDKEFIIGRRSQVRDLDSGEKFKTSTLGEIVSLEKSNKECHRSLNNNILPVEEVSLMIDFMLWGNQRKLSLRNLNEPLGLGCKAAWRHALELTESGAQVEFQEGLIYDHALRLDALPPTLFKGYDRDLKEYALGRGPLEMRSFHRDPYRNHSYDSSKMIMYEIGRSMDGTMFSYVS